MFLGRRLIQQGTADTLHFTPIVAGSGSPPSPASGLVHGSILPLFWASRNANGERLHGGRGFGSRKRVPLGGHGAASTPFRARSSRSRSQTSASNSSWAPAPRHGIRPSSASARSQFVGTPRWRANAPSGTSFCVSFMPH